MRAFHLLSAFILLSAAQMGQSYLIMPSSLTMDKVQDYYFGFIEGIGGVNAGGVHPTVKCFGPQTALEAIKVMEEFKSLSFSSKIKQLIPLFQNVVSLVSQLKQNCDFNTLMRHMLNNSKLESFTHFLGNIYMEVDHLLITMTKIQTYSLTGSYNQLGKAIGEFIGVVFNLDGLDYKQ